LGVFFYPVRIVTCAILMAIMFGRYLHSIKKMMIPMAKLLEDFEN